MVTVFHGRDWVSTLDRAADILTGRNRFVAPGSQALTRVFYIVGSRNLLQLAGMTTGLKQNVPVIT